MSKPKNLRDQLLEINQDYLGPAAERFLERQIATHLSKKPENITSADLIKLIDWLRLSFALLTDDIRIVNEYAQRLRLLANGEVTEALSRKWTSR